MGFPGGSKGNASACHTGDPGLIPGSGRSPGEGNGNPLQYCCLENPMDRGDWWATVHRVVKSQMQLSDYTFFSFFYCLHRMSLQDFKAHFMLLVICKLSPGLLTQEVGQKWSYTMLEGRWENGRTAGGQMKSPQGECVYGSQRLSRLKWQLLQAKAGLWAEPFPGAPS